MQTMQRVALKIEDFREISSGGLGWSPGHDEKNTGASTLSRASDLGVLCYREILLCACAIRI